MVSHMKCRLFDAEQRKSIFNQKFAVQIAMPMLKKCSETGAHVLRELFGSTINNNCLRQQLPSIDDKNDENSFMRIGQFTMGSFANGGMRTDCTAGNIHCNS